MKNYAHTCTHTEKVIHIQKHLHSEWFLKSSPSNPLPQSFANIKILVDAVELSALFLIYANSSEIKKNIFIKLLIFS